MRPTSAATLAATLLVAALAPTAAAVDAPAAEAPAAAPAEDAARQTLATYLEAVRTKKWDAAKKTLHPRTFEKIAEVKKRTGVESHGLAPWARVKQSYLAKFEILEAAPSARGAMVVRTSEEHFSVEDQGVEEGVRVEYLLIPAGGRWFVSDRRLGEGQFKADAVEAGYRGWFEGEFELPASRKAPRGKKGK